MRQILKKRKKWEKSVQTKQCTKFVYTLLGKHNEKLKHVLASMYELYNKYAQEWRKYIYAHWKLKYVCYLIGETLTMVRQHNQIISAPSKWEENSDSEGAGTMVLV